MKTEANLLKIEKLDDFTIKRIYTSQKNKGTHTTLTITSNSEPVEIKVEFKSDCSDDFLRAPKSIESVIHDLSDALKESSGDAKRTQIRDLVNTFKKEDAKLTQIRHIVNPNTDTAQPPIAAIRKVLEDV